jgi:aminoglycoside 3-N-acetyltransferase
MVKLATGCRLVAIHGKLRARHGSERRRMQYRESDIVEILAQSWRDAGMRSGDLVLVHSSIKRTLLRFRDNRPVASPKAVLESFLAAVGPTGTLLLPLFNFDFTTGKPFDIRTTPSQMGALTETGRRHPSAVRTGHPIYSFCAIGRESAAFRGVCNFSGYGPDSPFAILRKLGGKIGVLDLPDQDSITYYHHVEEMHEVDYRFHKTFSGAYTDAGGDTSERTFGLFVRDIAKGVITSVNPMGDLLWKIGAYSGNRPGAGSGFRMIDADTLHEEVSRVISAGKAKGLLYDIA